MITGDFEHLKELAECNVCAEHLSPLEVAWHDKLSVNVIRCGHDHYPEAVMPKVGVVTQYKRGAVAGSPVKEGIEKAITKGHEPPAIDRLSAVFYALAGRDLGTNVSLDQAGIALIFAFASKYKLDPYRGHVVLMYGKPYLGLDGYYYHADRSGKAYNVHTRPLTPDERKTYIVPDGAHAWTCEIVLPTEGRSFTGMGIVTQEEMTERSEKKPDQLRSPVVAKHPWQLAQKRAEWQALRRAFPIGESEQWSEKADVTG